MVNARRILTVVLLPGAILAFAAVAAFADDNVLYRCKDGSGNPAFTNTRQGYSDCRELGRFPKATTPARSSARVQAIEPAAAATSNTSPSNMPVASVAVGAVSQGVVAKPKVQRGAVYRYERDGVAHYTNVKPASAQAKLLFTYAIETCIACQLRSNVDWTTVALNLDDYGAEIAAAAAANGVDEALVRAVIHAESAYRSNALSNKNAQGLMQLIPATAERFGVTDVYDPAQNITGGVKYLAWLLNRFDGDVRLATAGYNAGEGAVDRHGGVPPYAETQVYVERVGILHARYRAALDAASPAATTAAVATGANH
jgi:soluble lytic murein transglycosylase-like protein